MSWSKKAKSRESNVLESTYTSSKMSDLEYDPLKILAQVLQEEREEGPEVTTPRPPVSEGSSNNAK
jgi:hypothetical protein